MTCNVFMPHGYQGSLLVMENSCCFCRGHHEELRCVLAVVRHGDRTPKQKMKMKVTQVRGHSQWPILCSIVSTVLPCNS